MRGRRFSEFQKAGRYDDNEKFIIETNLFLVYSSEQGENIPKSMLREFRKRFLEKDDVVQPKLSFDYLPTSNKARSALINQYIKSLESALNVTRTDISLAELWRKECPDRPKHADLEEYLELVSVCSKSVPEC